jgi:hypothetical protein
MGLIIDKLQYFFYDLVLIMTRRGKKGRQIPDFNFAKNPEGRQDLTSKDGGIESLLAEIKLNKQKGGPEVRRGF